MSLNTKRLASDIGKELAIIILEESRNDILKSITITGCDVTADMSFAKIYYTYYGDESKEVVATELEKCTPFLRKNLSDRVDMRHTPELKFIYDNSVEYGTKIEKLLKEITDNE